MRTAEEILNAAGFEMTSFISSSDYMTAIAAINTARIEAIREVHGIIGAMDWDVMTNTIDAKELQSKLNSLINEVK